jgi:Flp pilus assembly protein TadG
MRLSRPGTSTIGPRQKEMSQVMSRQTIKEKFRSLTRRFRADQAGGMMIMIAFASPLVIGGLAAGVETGIWYLAKRHAQQQADTAALGAARAKSNGITDYTTLSTIATRDAVRNGFVNVSPNAIVIGDPPTSGAYVGVTNTVQASVTVQVPLTFSKYFMGTSAITVTARAVAGTVTLAAGAYGCVMALNQSVSNSVLINGNVNASLEPCTIVSNSNNAQSIYMNGSVTVTANSIWSRGGIVDNGSTIVNLTNPAQANQTYYAADPYASSSVGSIGSCTANNFSLNGNGSANISPGVYCGGISIGGGKSVNMAPGTYYIDKGNFEMSGSSSISCSGCTGDLGVTIVLTSRDGTSIGTMSLGGSTQVDLKAPSGASDPFRGYSIYQDRRVAANAMNLTGNGQNKITGAVYAPKAAISLNGNPALTNGRKCVQLIGDTVTFSGSVNLDVGDCEAYGTKPITTTNSNLALRLLE